MTGTESLQPPRPVLALNVGITGHRTARLPAGTEERIRPIVDGVFDRLRCAARRLHEAEAAYFDPALPILRLHTPLATGADQIAAAAAAASGFQLHALMPFAPAEYAEDFAAGAERARYHELLAATQSTFALPCERSDGDGAYVSVGKAVIAASDVIVAIWDGQPHQGRGGTSHIVDLSLRAGVPVIHVATTDPGPVCRLLVGGRADKPQYEQLETAADYGRLTRTLLAPPRGEQGAHLSLFLEQRQRRTNARMEYPLLLAVTGIRRLRLNALTHQSIADDVAAEWSSVRGAMADAGPKFLNGLAALEWAYGWANTLAMRYAQLFRSGHLANYVLSAVAVVLALTGLLLPERKFQLVIVELCVIGLLFINTQAGKRGGWHRRWLQYRHLAESLRPLPYLKRTALAPPPFRRSVSPFTSRDTAAPWTRWYASAIWRQMPAPEGIMTSAEVSKLGRLMVQDQILPQAEYHRTNAEKMHRLDHRLHKFGNALLWTVVATCLLFLIGYALFPEDTTARAAWFVFITAGLPAVGAAVFGMRGHGEYQLAASRSLATASALEACAAKVGVATRLEQLAEIMEEAAATMQEDLGEWTLAYKDRSLEIPA